MLLYSCGLFDGGKALKAMTLWSAYQHFEENTKGSIKVGTQPTWSSCPTTQ